MWMSLLSDGTSEISPGLKTKASSVNKIRKFWYFLSATNILLALREHKKGSKIISDSSRRKNPKCNFSLCWCGFQLLCGLRRSQRSIHTRDRCCQCQCLVANFWEMLGLFLCLSTTQTKCSLLTLDTLKEFIGLKKKKWGVCLKFNALLSKEGLVCIRVGCAFSCCYEISLAWGNSSCLQWNFSWHRAYLLLFTREISFESAALRCAVALMRPLELYSTLTKQNGDQLSVNELLPAYVSEGSPVM